MTTTVSPARTRSVRPLVGAAWGILAAVVLDVIVFLAGNALIDGSIQTAQSGQSPADLPVAAVIAAAVVPLLLGALVLWVIARFSTSALRIWTVAVVILTLLSLVVPFTLQVDSGSKVALGLMHVLTGASAIWGQRRAAISA